MQARRQNKICWLKAAVEIRGIISSEFISVIKVYVLTLKCSKHRVPVILAKSGGLNRYTPARRRRRRSGSTNHRSLGRSFRPFRCIRSSQSDDQACSKELGEPLNDAKGRQWPYRGDKGDRMRSSFIILFTTSLLPSCFFEATVMRTCENLLFDTERESVSFRKVNYWIYIIKF